uniref:Uncharacterized protein n=1 Tax=Anguilla anguilla TaxID=7936 RepID=A0A0E9VY69_ANGAN
MEWRNKICNQRNQWR